MAITIELSDEFAQELRRQLGSNVEALQILVELAASALAAADAELTRLQATDEHDMEFNDPRTVTPENPQGTFSPLSVGNREKAIAQAQSDRDGAYIRHQWASKQLQEATA